MESPAYAQDSTGLPYNRSDRDSSRTTYNRSDRDSSRTTYNRSDRDSSITTYNRSDRDSSRTTYNRSDQDSAVLPYNRSDQDSAVLPYNRSDQDSSRTTYTLFDKSPEYIINRRDLQKYTCIRPDDLLNQWCYVPETSTNIPAHAAMVPVDDIGENATQDDIKHALVTGYHKLLETDKNSRKKYIYNRWVDRSDNSVRGLRVQGAAYDINHRGEFIDQYNYIDGSIMVVTPIMAVDKIIALLQSRKMTIVWDPEDICIISPTSLIMIQCQYGHRCHIMACYVDITCNLCRVQAKFSVPGIIPTSNDYSASRLSYRFQCARNHRFTVSLQDNIRECPCCVIVERLLKFTGRTYRISTRSEYNHNESPLRITCDCNDSFYSSDLSLSEDRIRRGESKELLCNNHVRDVRKNARYYLEILFGYHFDDSASFDCIYPTAMSSNVGVVVVDDCDKIAMSQLNAIRFWCHYHRYILCIIGKNVVSIANLYTTIMSEIATYGIFPQSTIIPGAFMMARKAAGDDQKILKDRITPPMHKLITTSSRTTEFISSDAPVPKQFYLSAQQPKFCKKTNKFNNNALFYQI